MTVDGVTGSTPIVVQQAFSLTAPTITYAGNTFTATTSLPNTSSAALTNIAMTLSAPSGWTVRAPTPPRIPMINRGQTGQTTWRVTVPATATPSSYELSGQATSQDVNGAGLATADSGIAVPYSALGTAFNNPGISDDSNPSAGNLDGGGFSYSARALAAAGLAPGGRLTHDGLTFTWPNAPAGAPDNLIASGQTIALSGTGSTLGLLGTANNGTVTGTGTITYTDGSSQPFDIALADWWASAATPGSDILAAMPYLNTASGRRNRAVNVYYAGIPLQTGKQVSYVTLPNVSPSVAAGQPATHIFAITIG